MLLGSFSTTPVAFLSKPLGSLGGMSSDMMQGAIPGTSNVKDFFWIFQLRIKQHHFLGGGFKYVLFSSLFGEMIQFD